MIENKKADEFRAENQRLQQRIAQLEAEKQKELDHASCKAHINELSKGLSEALEVIKMNEDLENVSKMAVSNPQQIDDSQIMELKERLEVAMEENRQLLIRVQVAEAQWKEADEDLMYELHQIKFVTQRWNLRLEAADRATQHFNEERNHLQTQIQELQKKLHEVELQLSDARK